MLSLLNFDNIKKLDNFVCLVIFDD